MVEGGVCGVQPTGEAAGRADVPSGQKRRLMLSRVHRRIDGWRHVIDRTTRREKVSYPAAPFRSASVFLPINPRDTACSAMATAWRDVAGVNV